MFVDFKIIADERSDEKDHSQPAIFVHIIVSDNRAIERFLGVTCVGISKTAAAIMDIISIFVKSKEIKPSYKGFCGLGETNFISSKHCGLPCQIRHYFLHVQRINCCNHRLVLFHSSATEFPGKMF